MPEERRRAPLQLGAAYIHLIEHAESLATRSSAGESLQLEAKWAELTRAFEARVAFEEEVLFPAFAGRSGERRALIKRLVEDHAAMCELLLDIGRQLQRCAVCPVTIELLLDLLREHAAIESNQVDPWIELDGRGWSVALERVPTDP